MGCSLEVQPDVLNSGLEQKPVPTQDSSLHMLDLLEESMGDGVDSPPPPSDPQPFSQRRSMFSAGDTLHEVSSACTYRMHMHVVCVNAG